VCRSSRIDRILANLQDLGQKQQTIEHNPEFFQALYEEKVRTVGVQFGSIEIVMYLQMFLPAKALITTRPITDGCMRPHT
jgi:hypothetical protein